MPRRPLQILLLTISSSNGRKRRFKQEDGEILEPVGEFGVTF